MSVERSMNNHDKLGNMDIGNLALKLIFGVTVARVLSSVDWGKRAPEARWPGFKCQHHPLTAMWSWERHLTSVSVSSSVK